MMDECFRINTPQLCAWQQKNKKQKKKKTGMLVYLFKIGMWDFVNFLIFFLSKYIECIAFVC